MSRCYPYPCRERILIDYGFDDVYLREARQGHHILALHLASYEQLEQVRDLLAPHHAHHMKYVDTWTVADLLPSPEHSVQQVWSQGEAEKSPSIWEQHSQAVFLS